MKFLISFRFSFHIFVVRSRFICCNFIFKFITHIHRINCICCINTDSTYKFDGRFNAVYIATNNWSHFTSLSNLPVTDDSQLIQYLNLLTHLWHVFHTPNKVYCPIFTTTLNVWYQLLDIGITIYMLASAFRGWHQHLYFGISF